MRPLEIHPGRGGAAARAAVRFAERVWRGSGAASGAQGPQSRDPGRRAGGGELSRGAPRPLRAQLHRRRAAHGALRRGGRSARGPRCRQRAIRRHLPHRAVLCAAHPGAAARARTAAHAARARPARRALPALSGRRERRGGPGDRGLRAGCAPCARRRQHSGEGRERGRGGERQGERGARGAAAGGGRQCGAHSAQSAADGTRDHHREPAERLGHDRRHDPGADPRAPGLRHPAEHHDAAQPRERARGLRAHRAAPLYTHTRLGHPVLLKREVIATGDQLTNATTGQSQEGPAVNVRLDARAGESMLKTTRANVNKRMAVVLIEKRRETSDVNGRKVTRDVTDEEVINDATIRGIFSNNFQITGLAAGEARELALLLRSGSLAIPLYPIEERAVGPSLGRDNIDKGVTALIVGMAGVFVFMWIYYKTFGLVADAVLLSNVVLLTALLSMMRASLSLPGIAGIILTVGMAVDANVLIYERIREELRKGVTPQAAIRAGFEKAFSAIADSNITTLIAGVVLWVFGTGPIRGFAVVLTLGIATSMFTSLMGSRALLTLMYGGRRKLARLSI
ncbi:MAG: protein translocase subunit SecD [Gammaproteobacteria bacterium]|nr:MAG: protein translocase subunit SecD [Gammaproteobacteria bacterium]